MASDPVAILALMRSRGLGYASVNRVMAWAAGAERELGELFGLSERALLSLLPTGVAHAAEALSAIDEDALQRARASIDRCVQTGAQPVLVDDADYPNALRAGRNSVTPPLLFVLGDLDALHAPAAAVVGTRKPSEEGRALAAGCAATLAGAEVLVVSGGARGVDLAAHHAALESGGRTLVVLPQGLMSYRGPREILEGIDSSQVVLVSEFEPDAGFSSHGAIARNATIAGLARLVCVIEAGETGGSVRTARAGLSQGKPVLVYGASGGKRVHVALVRAGAVALQEEANTGELGAVLDAWAGAPDLGANQAELF